MNILVIDNFNNVTRCAAIFVEDQIKEFHRLGHDVRVIIPIGLGKKDYQNRRLSPVVNEVLINDVPHVFVRYASISKYGSNGFNTSMAIKSVRKHIKEIMSGFEPDIIHAHKLGFGSNIGAVLKKIFHCPLVVTTHGGDTIESLKKGWQNKICAWGNEADVLVAVSSSLKRKLISTGTTTKTSVILNGHICSDFVCQTPYKKYPITLLQVGSLISQKNVNVTIRSFASLCAKRDGSHLYIVGTGDEERNLRNLCKKLGVEEQITFTGQLANEEVLSLMQLADFFIMPSVDEGFGIVYIEAMSQKCLTIGTKGEGIEDFIRNGENGFLVSANDSLEICEVIDKCLEYPDYAKKVIEQGAKDADLLTWKRNAESYIELFQSLV